jgi:hypothetical protein
VKIIFSELFFHQKILIKFVFKLKDESKCLFYFIAVSLRYIKKSNNVINFVRKSYSKALHSKVDSKKMESKNMLDLLGFQ